MTCIVVSALIVAVLIAPFVLNRLYKHTNAYRNQFVDIGKFMNMASVRDKSLDVAVLGSNAPKFAFDFTDVEDYACENWAIGPETFEYDFIILKKFAGKLKRGATVVWPVCPGNFFLDKYKDRSAFVKYYRLLGRDEFPDCNRRQYLMECKYPLIFHPKRIKHLLRDVKPDARLSLGHNPMNAAEIEKDAAWWIHGCWNPEFGIDIEHMAPLSERNRKAVEYNIGVLKDAIRFCQENGLRLVFAYLPLTKELGGYFSPGYVEGHMTRYVKAAIGDNPIPLADYMRDGRFQDTGYYINSFFLNRTGARQFTKVFLEENL